MLWLRDFAIRGDSVQYCLNHHHPLFVRETLSEGAEVGLRQVGLGFLDHLINVGLAIVFATGFVQDVSYQFNFPLIYPTFIR